MLSVCTLCELQVYTAHIHDVADDLSVTTHNIQLMLVGSQPAMFSAKIHDRKLTLFAVCGDTIHYRTMLVTRLTDTTSGVSTLTAVSDISAITALDDQQVIVAGIHGDDKQRGG